MRSARSLVLAIALVVVGCGGEAEVRPSSALAVDTFAISAPAVDGSQVDLRSFANRDLVVWFWAPW